MTIKKIKFVAARWHRTLADDGETVIMKAMPGGEDFPHCLVVAEPHSKNGQAWLEFHCEEVSCEGECELIEHVEPDGHIEYECRCEE